ncbi:MAG: hypothetical protein V3R99_02290, partial [Thermoguttaceae bacterium]
LVLLGGLVGMVLLLVYPKTRVVGVVLLAIGLMTVLLGGGLLFSYKMVRQSEQQQQRAAMDRVQAVMEMQRARRALDEGPVEEIIIEDDVRPETTGEATVAEEEAVAEVASDEDMALTATADSDTAKTDATGTDTTEADTTESDTPPDEPDVSSTEPEEPAAAEQRPAWVDAPPGRVDDVYQMAVSVGPYISRLECDAKLPDALSEAVQQYASTTIGPKAVGRISLPADFLTEQLVAEQWQEAVQTSFGPMVQLHVLARFDANVKQDVESAWKQAVITERVWLAGIGMSFVLGFLAILFVGLKITRRRDSQQRPSKTEPGGGRPRPGPVRAMVLAVLVAAGVSMLAVLLTQKGTTAPGPIELLLLLPLIIVGVVLLAVAINRNLWPWILGYVVCAAVAVFCTPADPASTLIVAVPLCFVYTLILILWRRGSRSRPQPAPDGVAERTVT